MNPNGHRKKIFSLAVKATKIFIASPRQLLFNSTYFRMFYLSKPITVLTNKTSQLFSGRVNY